MEFNVADLLERVTDNVPRRTALIMGDVRLTYEQTNARANRAGHLLRSLGVERGEHVGIYAYNCIEWVDVMLGCFKIGAVPINLNYRYVGEELRYVLDDADVGSIVYHQEFAPVLKQLAEQGFALNNYIAIADDSGEMPGGPDHIDYRDAVSRQPETQDFPRRSGDDLYVLYTGGTTGLPKGVVWRQEDVIMTLGGGMDVVSEEPFESPEFMADRCLNPDASPLNHLVVAPLMHGAAQWLIMRTLFEGSVAVMSDRRSFSGHYVWRLVEKYRINAIFITGDAMARPMMDAYLEGGYDASSLFVLVSAAALFSPMLKELYAETFPDLIVMDSFGASELGYGGARTHGPDDRGGEGGGPRITPSKRIVLLDDDRNVLPMGGGETGWIAKRGRLPQGYYKDEEKTRRTFVTASDGKRYAIPGDMGISHPDGTITLLGRGSTSINSGGEKIYPEEVEAAVKTHPAVLDCLVVGTPDERWGQSVAALIQCREGEPEPSLDDIHGACSEHVARYKLPRRVFFLDELRRTPSGKPDYSWARKTALELVERDTLD